MTGLEIPPAGMALVSGGLFHYQAQHRFREGGFVLFHKGPGTIPMLDFFMDCYEVTNAAYKRFLEASGYQPPVTHHHKFLLLHPGIDRCATIGFRCVASQGPTIVERWY